MRYLIALCLLCSTALADNRIYNISSQHYASSETAAITCTMIEGNKTVIITAEAMEPGVDPYIISYELGVHDAPWIYNDDWADLPYPVQEAIRDSLNRTLLRATDAAVVVNLTDSRYCAYVLTDVTPGIVNISITDIRTSYLVE